MTREIAERSWETIAVAGVLWAFSIWAITRAIARAADRDAEESEAEEPRR